MCPESLHTLKGICTFTRYLKRSAASHFVSHSCLSKQACLHLSRVLQTPRDGKKNSSVFFDFPGWENWGAHVVCSMRFLLGAYYRVASNLSTLLPPISCNLVNMTLPDLAFACSELSEYVQRPGKAHMTTAEHTLWYLRGTFDKSVFFSWLTYYWYSLGLWLDGLGLGGRHRHLYSPLSHGVHHHVE
jgi:hypothetical protein